MDNNDSIIEQAKALQGQILTYTYDSKTLIAQIKNSFICNSNRQPYTSIDYILDGSSTLPLSILHASLPSEDILTMNKPTSENVELFRKIKRRDGMRQIFKTFHFKSKP